MWGIRLNGKSISKIASIAQFRGYGSPKRALFKGFNIDEKGSSRFMQMLEQIPPSFNHCNFGTFWG